MMQGDGGFKKLNYNRNKSFEVRFAYVNTKNLSLKSNSYLNDRELITRRKEVSLLAYTLH